MRPEADNGSGKWDYDCRNLPLVLRSSRDFVDRYVVCGMPWGIFQSLTTTYASEVAPIKL